MGNRKTGGGRMKDESKKKLIVGFQGVPGSFGEEALLAYFGDSVCTKALDTFEDIFKKLIGQEIDFGVLPIENSSTGAITEVYDLLNQYDCSIIGEVCLPIQHHLMGIRGASIADIREVYSHPQGFEQSSKFLKQYPNWKLIPYYNTAKSAEWVQKNNQKHMGAIASEKAAKLYNLQILAFGINSNQHNTTRFIIISREQYMDEESDKISIVLSTPHRAGSLYRALRHFAENQINMLKIESRPIPDKPWEYFFYIDFEGNLNHPPVQKAIQSMRKDSTYFKILGNYKKTV